MGILERFGTIMKSNINALLDKCEDPAKMIDQMLIDAKHDLADVRKETANVMANAKRAEQQVLDCQREISEYQQAAKNALVAGQEDDAKTLLSRKQAQESKLVELQKVQQMTGENADAMRQMHDKLVSDIKNLEDRRDVIQAKVATAKAQSRMNDVMAGGRKARTSLDAFDKMEDKADKMLNSAMAKRELNEGDAVETDLLRKYSGSGGASVDDELEAMKAELGL